jgi:hypothetical protein
MTSTIRPSCPGISGARPYPFPIDPPQLRHDSASTTISRANRPRLIRRPQGITCPLQRLGCLVIPLSPRHPRDGPVRRPQGMARRHSSAHSAHPAFFSKTPPRFCCKPRPSPCVYKRGGLGDLKEKKEKKHKIGVLSTLVINISSNTPPFSSLETWV